MQRLQNEKAQLFKMTWVLCGHLKKKALAVIFLKIKQLYCATFAFVQQNGVVLNFKADPGKHLRWQSKDQGQCQIFLIYISPMLSESGGKTKSDWIVGIIFPHMSREEISWDQENHRRKNPLFFLAQCKIHIREV